MKNHTTPSGLLITFDPSTHRYSDASGHSYDSVTRVVQSLFPPFDADGSILRRVSAQKNISPETLKSSWKSAGQIAAARGTLVHAVAEAVLLSRPPAPLPPSAPDRDRSACVAAFDTAAQILAAASYVAPEQIIADPDSLTAGTVDAIAFRRDAASTCIILDWKTNSRTLTDEPDYGTRALPPYSHLRDNHLVRYSLQLALYADILHRAGYLPPDIDTKLYIVHIQSDNTDNPDNPNSVGDVVAAAHDNPPAAAVHWIPALDLSDIAADILLKRRSHHHATQAAVNAVRAAKPGQPSGDQSSTITGDDVADVPSPTNEDVP